MHSSTTEPIRRGRAVLRTHGTRSTARPARSRPIVVFCRSARWVDPRRPCRTPLQVPAVRNPVAPRPPTGVPGGRPPDPDMHDAPIGARRRSCGASRMPHMPDTPRLAAIASNVASCMIREPPRVCDPDPPPFRCPPLKPCASRPPRNQRPDRPARTPGGTASRLGPLGIRPRHDQAGRESSGWTPSAARPQIRPRGPGPRCGSRRRAGCPPAGRHDERAAAAPVARRSAGRPCTARTAASRGSGRRRS